MIFIFNQNVDYKFNVYNSFFLTWKQEQKMHASTEGYAVGVHIYKLYFCLVCFDNFYILLSINTDVCVSVLGAWKTCIMLISLFYFDFIPFLTIFYRWIPDIIFEIASRQKWLKTSLTYLFVIFFII